MSTDTRSSAKIRRLGAGDETRLIEVARLFKSSKIDPAHAGAFLLNRSNVVIVAEREGQLAGFALCFLLDRIDRTARQLFIYEVDVAPEHQRSGVGTRLMEWVRAFVADERLMEAFVVADQNNTAAAGLYQTTGAHADGGPAVVFVFPGQAA